MTKPVQSIVIVGGGNAGWITAGLLAAKFKAEFQAKMQGAEQILPISITLVESSNIPTVGVGEGTWPTMRKTLQKIGIRETDFIRECHVSFKQGAKFANWKTDEKNEFYYHPLVLPEDFDNTNLVPHWLNHSAATTNQNTVNLNSQSPRSFVDAVCVQGALCDQHLAPKLITTPEYDAVANYAYHLDAGAFTTFLKNHCVNKLGVTHIIDDVTAVNNTVAGDIAAVETAQHGAIKGDLFIDCTGFKSLLIGEHFKVPFKSCKDVLFADSALAMQVPYADEQAEIASHTISTGQPAGWIWDIGLPTRRGVGYVYSSQYTSESEAIAQLQQYLAPTVKNVENINIKKIPINPGHREQFWVNNCVAIGLSAGFLEPLEASALVLVEMSAQMIAEQFPADRNAMNIIAKRFNKTFLYRWARIIDFLKLHYVLSERQEPFWADNRMPESIPESLKELLTLWQTQYPSYGDFEHFQEVFPAASYQYVLYGMGFKTQNIRGVSAMSSQQAEQQFKKVAAKTDHLLHSLPTHRELINKIIKYGLQRV